MKRYIIFTLLCTLLFSCSSKTERFGLKKSSQVIPEADMATTTFSDSITKESLIFEQELKADNIAPIQRKLIKNGYITITVKDINECGSRVNNLLSKMNAYISSSNNYNSTCSFTIRIPSTNFEQAMSLLGDFGKVKSQNISTQDVTDEFYDLETRINTKKVLQEKYSEYLKKADNLKDLLEIESQLNTVISDLEVIQGQMKRLSNQIDYSTINVTFLSEIPDKEEVSIEWPDLSGAWNRFVTKFMAFFVGFVKVIIYIIIFGCPIIALLALLFWLLFGKIGLLKKLFKKLK